MQRRFAHRARTRWNAAVPTAGRESSAQAANFYADGFSAIFGHFYTDNWGRHFFLATSENFFTGLFNGVSVTFVIGRLYHDVNGLVGLLVSALDSFQVTIADVRC